MESSTPLRRGPSRREFLTSASLTAAGMMCGLPRALAGNVLRVPLDTPHSAEHWLEPTVPDLLRSLATHAVDAATHAGASYADVRIAEQHLLKPGVSVIQRSVSIRSQCTFGVRALVNDVWGFAYGRIPTPDGVARCAEEAVHSARTAAQLASTIKGANRSATWTPAPAITGEWESPCQIDPFTVPLQEHGEAMTAITRAAWYAYGAEVDIDPRWLRETRVLATSGGTLLTQHRRAVMFHINNFIRYGSTWVAIRLPDLHGTSAGYEVLLNPVLQDHMKAAAEQAASITKLPQGIIDVGRYPVVFDGTSMGAFLTHLLGPALELDRVQGDENDTVGTSPFTIDQLGTQVTSPLLTLTAHRTAPSICAARWDDDGAETREHTVIRDGQLVDFHTNGQTVSALQSWYQRQGRPAVSNGCATASEADNLPLLQSPHLAMRSSMSQVSLEDLYKDMKRGILLVHQDWVAPDQGITSASIYPRSGAGTSAAYTKAGGMMFEIVNGKIVRRLVNVALQLNTIPFLKTLTALGGPNTVHDATAFVTKGMPWQMTYKGTTAPAAFFKEANAITVARR